MAGVVQRGPTDISITQLQCSEVRLSRSFRQWPCDCKCQVKVGHMRRNGKAIGALAGLWCIAFCSCLPTFAATASQVNSATRTGSRSKKTIVYKNKKYRFRFVLPESWKGYSILVSQWTGSAWDPVKRENPTREVTGPMITIRHPLWTESDPRQDIPIMILTDEEADLSQQDNLSTSAAPFGPQEIARNAKYVFALPPRYNYAFPTGFEEVEQLFREHSLHPF